MINEERVILMTRMASYEQHDEKKNMAIVNYFRNDYLGFEFLKSVICGTMAFLVVFGMYVFYDFETFMQDIYKIDLLAFGKKVLIIYLVCVGGYAVITYLVHAYRYHLARRSLRTYYNNLKKLQNMYERQG
ncbi:MAG: hypothetical protein Q4B72_01845 [Lachnospiraceae bacterium]|nr:hypothetical protein [Lachnospiraceae bacterium]